MTSPGEAPSDRGARRRTYGVTPYVAGRTMAEYAADGTLIPVDAGDEIAALSAYAAAHGLTLASDPVLSKNGKRLQATLSDGRDYLVRALKASLVEFLETEPIVAPPVAEPPDDSPTETEDGPKDLAAPSDEAEAAKPEPAPPPDPPEFIELPEQLRSAVERARPTLQPRSWDIAAALWGLTGDAPKPVQEVAERFAISPGFVRTVAESVVRLASSDE